MSKVLVKHIMSSPVITFFAEQTLPLAEDVMRAKHLRHLPVVDERGMLVGLVTHRDLLRAEISTLCGLTPDQRRAREDEVLIAQVMTRDVWTVTEDTLASVAGRTLLDHKYGCLPVVDATGFLVGIVTERDFMELAVKTLRAHDPENRSQWQPARPRKLHSRISSRLPLRARDTLDQLKEPA